MKRIFVDTNIWIYAHDSGTPAKRAKADQILVKLSGPEYLPVISTQVMQEFYNTLTNKLHIDRSKAREELRLLNNRQVVLLTPPLLLAATDLHAVDSISFWDALIGAAAQHADCDEIWSEDLQTNRTYGKLKVINPFSGT